MPTPGTTMAGIDCAEVSAAAWPSLLDGILGTVTVSDAESRAALRELAASAMGSATAERRRWPRCAR